MKYDHVISEFDNLIYLIIAVLISITAKLLDIPELHALSGACLVKIKGESKAQ